MAELARLLRSDRDKLAAKLEQVLDNSRRLEKELEQVKSKMASRAGAELGEQAELVNGIHVLARNMEGADPKTLRDTVDRLKSRLGTAIIVLATVKGDKVSLVAGVTKDSTDKVQAGELINFVAQQVGGRGGGRPDLAQAGGNDPSALQGALASVPAWVLAKTVGKTG